MSFSSGHWHFNQNELDPLLADLFLYSYESECLNNMIWGGHRNLLGWPFNLYYQYIDDLIVFNNKKHWEYVKEIYPSQLTLEKANTSDDLANYLDLIDNIFVQFGGRLFRQVIGIPMGTNWASLLADLFLYSYENEFLDNMIRRGHRRLARSFNLCYRYIDD